MDEETVREPRKNGKEETPPGDDTAKDSDAVWDQYINDAAAEDTEDAEDRSPTPSKPGHLRVSDDYVKDDRFPIGMIPEDDLIDSSALKLDEVLSGIQNLKKIFDEKIRNDGLKDKIIDELHKELQSHKNDFLKKYMELIMMDIIQFIDSMRKLASFYKEQDASAMDVLKLLGILEGIPSDLEDLCARQGVNAFCCPEDEFNPTRQRVLKRVDTSENAKDKMIAERMHPGYEWDGKVVRPELVTVYAYKAPPPETEMRKSDE